MNSPSVHFLTILAQALGQPEPQRSLADAFARIMRMGEQGLCSEGLSNFRHFMDVACCHADMIATQAARELILELATGALGSRQQEAAALRIIESSPKWKAEYEQMRAEQVGQSSLLASIPVIGVLGPEGKVGEMLFGRGMRRASVGGIFPGVWVLRLLNTGLVLWEGQLATQDLIWTAAHRDRPLPFAAQTEGSRRRPTRKWLLPERQIVLRTFAGLEKGTIEMELAQ